MVTLVLDVVLGPFQHGLKLVDLRYFEVSGHDHGDHCFGEVKEVGVVEDGKGPGRKYWEADGQLAFC